MSRFKDFFFLAGTVFAALILRLDFLVANEFVIDADEGIVGLMAKHIAQGEPPPVFYYGQHYMGSFESLLIALVFKAFGVSSAALKSVPLVLSLFLVPLVYALTRQISDERGARAAAILTAVCPSALVIWSSMARGGFIEIVVLGALSLLLAVKWLKEEKPTVFASFLIGVVLGFGWWVNNQVVYFALPIGFFMLGRLLWGARPGGAIDFLQNIRAVLVHCTSGMLGFFAGSLPFWIYNFQNGFKSFEMLRRARSSDMLAHLCGVFDTAIPILLGARRFWQTEDLFPYSSSLAAAIYAALLLIVLWPRRRAILDLLRFKIDSERPVELFLTFLVVCLGVFVASSFGYLVEAPRYLLPLYVGIFVLSGASLSVISVRMPLAAKCLLLVIIGLNLCSSYLGGRALPGEPFVFKGERVAKSHAELIEWLKQNEIIWVRTNYWIGYRLAFETREQVRFLIFQAPFQTRIQKYREAAAALDPRRMPLILVPAQGQIVRSALQAMGYTFREALLSGYVVLYDIAPGQEDLKPIAAHAVSVGSDRQFDQVLRAVDGNLNTRWGSGEPQKTGMRFITALNPPQRLRGLVYELGKWWHDYPRGLLIGLELENGKLQPLFDPERWGAIRYLLESESTLAFYFDPVVVRRVLLLQLGSDPVFDWSIAELTLMQ